ncbi:RNA polymerase sigma factor [Bauldia sp.]|uniref:RNA polymerase sigma factor n=1 Tax=Bauldia sp. TaxID=2575872 RepID=UPI003BA9A4EE
MPDPFGAELIKLLPNLRRFALSLCGSADVADDLVQLTCQKALSNRGSFAAGTRMDAWLFRILRNAWIDIIRKRKTEGATDAVDTAELVGTDGVAASESRLALGETMAAISRLPEDQREVLVLVCIEELSYKETAAVLDLPIGTVMSRLARARKKLAADLGIDGLPIRSDSVEKREAR